MELQNNIFDEFKAAADGEEEVPFKEQLWSRIESRLDEEPEKRRAFVPWVRYMAASVVLLVGSGIVWQLSRDENTTPATEVAQHTTQQQATEILVTDADSNKTITEPSKTGIIAVAPKAPVKQYSTETPTENTGQHVAATSAKHSTLVQSEQADKDPVKEHTNTHVASSYVTDSISVLAHATVQAEQANNTIAANPASNKAFLFNSVVIDKDMESIVGAVIQLKGTNQSVMSDDEGKFSMQVPDSNATLIVSSFGAKTKEINLRQLHSKWITLGDNSTSLDEVVVYGAKLDSRSYVGAVSTVTAKEIAKRPVTSVAAALDGAAPGVLVTKGGGQPGSNPDIMVRGMGSLSASSAPLIVLDGAPYSGALNSINPGDIKDLVILKDATSKAVYGARAANGVILVTTKRGEEDGIKDGNLFDNVFKRKNKRKKTEAPTEQQPPARAEEQAHKEEQTRNEEAYELFEENKFESPLNQPLSTFSIDVDKASYANIRRFIINGAKVPKDAVRIEEMINYFSYKYPQPEAGKPFSINTEYSDAPWNPQHRLLKIGLQGRIIPQDQIPPSNLVFLIDVSGSMSDHNKLPYVQKSMELLTRQLRKEDHVAIVVYAGAAGLVLPSTSGDQKEKIMDAINRLNAGGSTAGGAGIELAYKVAKENFIPNGNNRIILATDGDFNVGASSDRSMQELIEEKRKDNIFLTCLGFGMGNYKDSKMEILADKGNGNYAYIDNLAEAQKTLQKEFGSTMFAIAKDVKIQIEFNPALVQSYRLIGYENRKLNAEDFANDAIDAGELGSGHTVTALYEIIPKGVSSPYAVAAIDHRYTTAVADSSLSQSNELARVQFRYKEPNEETSKLMTQLIPNNLTPAKLISKDFRLAASVAWLGLQLRDSKLVPDKSLNHIASFAKEAIDKDNKEETELVKLIEATK
ncbi:VWA domain-containing protein [Edaphocola aurantiacus]|uniref:VWA domain-containing protein n=1 Tax=Edaphocola aurantiacus TaxID=2601682 RepID=UPI001C974437|nr:VWA domain-containing protein [Edaphocola aurantiacus]